LDPALFLDDLLRRPESLQDLQRVLVTEDPWHVIPDDVEQVLFVGMGSSTFAAGVAAARLRAQGVDALAELASSELLPPPDPDRLVVAISASGGSRETQDAMGQYAGQSPVVVLTNTPESGLTKSADGTVLMHAGDERGGVSCRSYTHTQVLLMALEARLTGADRDVLALVAKAAEATADLLDRRQDWLPAVIDSVAGPDGSSVVAPFRRFGNAQQAALMFREGPRRPAVASETGEWSHVDVYLTKTQDYRMLLFAGSACEAELLRWTSERNATVVSVGAEIDGATSAVRYRHDEVDDVRLLVELVVAELVAAHLWMDSPAN
jgi:fructoselysine-6-P-deglycase FrlB-like protein